MRQIQFKIFRYGWPQHWLPLLLTLSLFACANVPPSASVPGPKLKAPDPVAMTPEDPVQEWRDLVKKAQTSDLEQNLF